MGFFLSKFGWSSDPAGYDIADPKTGLTPRQADIVKDTWAVVRKDVKGNGIDLFIRFFTLFPDNQKMFRAFADVPLDQLRGNAKLLGHATAVMYSLSSLVDNLGDLECLTELLVKVADSHVPRKVTEIHFQNLTDVLIPFLCEKLGPSVMDESAKEAWLKVMNVVNSTIKAEMEKQNAASSGEK